MSDGLRADPPQGTGLEAPFAKGAHGAGRWHTQSILGGGGMPPEKRGDCVRACITSILGLPLDALENVHGDRWWDRLQNEAFLHGYQLALLDMRFDPPPEAYWVATLPSLNLGPEPDGSPANHCVVARGYTLIHDPSLGARYDADAWAAAWADGKVVEGWALVPVDPSHVAVARVSANSPSSAPPAPCAVPEGDTPPNETAEAGDDAVVRSGGGA